MTRLSGDKRIILSASLFSDGKFVTPTAAPKLEKSAMAEVGQMTIKLSGSKKREAEMIAVELPSVIFQFSKLNFCDETFFTSINSVGGKPITGVGSARISSITTSYRPAFCAQTALQLNLINNRVRKIFLIDSYIVEIFFDGKHLWFIFERMMNKKHTKRNKRSGREG